MYKLLFTFLILTTLLLSNDEIEMFAGDIYTENEILYANGQVNVVYKDFFISAKRAKYDKSTGKLELFENVRATQGNNYKILGEYAKIDLHNKQREFKPFYMLDNQSKVWISALDGTQKEKNVEVESGIVSGCNPNDPLWKIQFSSSDYNEDTKWLNTYNNTLYIYDIPVLYIPYFGYSLDRKRRSGILYPSLGISSDEGFFYEQPIYIAEQNWWDLEIKPQIRTKRGSGIYSTFRFVDSKVSQGSFTYGNFKEDIEYFEETNLENRKHFGADFNYYNSNLLYQWFGFKYSGQSVLYADIHHMSDVDYINLSSNDSQNSSTAQQTISRVNFFYNNADNYLGVYLKYFQDLTLDDNSQTLQKIPTSHYHHYLETLFSNSLIYNLNLKNTNIYRKDGVGVVQTDVDIPLTFHTSVFDEYINLSYKTFFYSQLSSFTGLDEIDNPDEYRDGYFAKNYSVLHASTSLTKAFKKYTHVVNLGTKYTLSGSKEYDGYYEDYKNLCSTSDTGFCEFYNVGDSTDGLQFEFSQYLFDSSGKQKLYHKLVQNIVYNDDTNASEDYGDLENELSYQLTSNLNFYNNIFYNYDNNDFSKIYSQLTYSDNGLNLSISYNFEDKFHEKNVDYGNEEPYAKYLTSGLSYKYNNHYAYNALYKYDVQINQIKELEVGFLYQKRCWDFGIKYLESNRPILTSVDSEYHSVYERYIYFTILLKPFMQARGEPSSSYKLPKTYKGK